MHIGLLTLRFHLEGCSSLKQKRSRLGGLRDRFGRHPQVAACESAAADSHDKAQWSFACIAQNRSDVTRILDKIEDFAASELDAVIYQRELEFL